MKAVGGRDNIMCKLLKDVQAEVPLSVKTWMLEGMGSIWRILRRCYVITVLRGGGAAGNGK